MKLKTLLAVSFVLLIFVVPANVLAGDAANYTRTEDVIYGRKYGVALTLDVIKPKENLNGLGIIYCLSGGWISDHNNVVNIIARSQPLLKRGYTIFAVVHGSQPKFTIPE